MPGMSGGPRAGNLPNLGSGIPDGTANTIIVVEAGTPVVWTKPDDVPYDAKKPLPKLGGQFPSVINVLAADGRAWALPRRVDEQSLRLAINPSDGRPFDLPKFAAAGSSGNAVRQALVDNLRKRNTRLKEEAALLRDTLVELKEEMEGLRWAVEQDKLLEEDPTAAALKRENANLEKALRETRDEARKMFAEIRRLREEMRKRKK
jgi:hypothetical protein